MIPRFFVDISSVGGSLIPLLLLVPLTGSLVRLRANYNPKRLQLDAEGVVRPYTGPQVTSFFGMLARVKRIEACIRILHSPDSVLILTKGWSGLYKGLSKNKFNLSDRS
jgi:hypothetical protein